MCTHWRCPHDLNLSECLVVIHVHMSHLTLYVTFTWPETEIQSPFHVDSWIDGWFLKKKIEFWCLPYNKLNSWTFVFFLILAKNLLGYLNLISSNEILYCHTAVTWRLHCKPLHRWVFFRLLTMSRKSVLYWNKKCNKHPHKYLLDIHMYEA